MIRAKIKIRSGNKEIYPRRCGPMNSSEEISKSVLNITVQDTRQKFIKQSVVKKAVDKYAKCLKSYSYPTKVVQARLKLNMIDNSPCSSFAGACFCVKNCLIIYSISLSGIKRLYAQRCFSSELYSLCQCPDNHFLYTTFCSIYPQSFKSGAL